MFHVKQGQSVPNYNSLDPYTPQSRLLAELLAKQRDNPVYSAGQGIADVLGDVGSAYFQKKQLDKDEAKADDKARILAKAMQTAMNPNFSQANADNMNGNPMAAQSAFSGGMPPNAAEMLAGAQPQQAQPALPQGYDKPLSNQARTLAAMQQLGQSPEMAARFTPEVVSMAQSMQKQMPTPLPAVKPGESIPMRDPNTGNITYNTAPGTAPISGALGEAASALKAGIINQAQFDAIVKKQGTAGEGRESYHPMSPDELKRWGLPPGTVASMSSNGKPDIVNKAQPGSFLTDQGISPDATPEDIRVKLSSNEAGANLVRQADAVLEGREELQKVSARSGETQGNQLRAVVYALDPKFNPMVGKQRMQVNTELNNLSDRAMGGKIASANKIVNHATNLLDQAIDLKNDSMFGNLGNKVENYAVGVGTGGAMKTNLRSFTNTKDLLGTESAKFMGGGVASDSARAEVDKNYNPNDDISGTIGAVGSTVDMMKGQLQPMVDRYNQAFGTNLAVTDPKFMSPETAAKFQLLEGILAQAKSGAPVEPAKLKAALAGVNGSGGAGGGDKHFEWHPEKGLTPK